MSPECIKLTSSVTCSPFSEFAFNSTALSSYVGRKISTVSEFDDYIQSNTFSTSQTSLDYFRTRFQCTPWTGEGLRYMLSYACLWSVSSVSSGCNPRQPKICQRNWAALRESLSSVINNSTTCPGNPNTRARRQQEMDSFLDLGNRLIGNSTYEDCLAPTTSESISCGFGSNHIETALAYCYSQQGDVSECCTSVPGYASPSTGTIVPAESLNIPALIGGAVGGALLLFFVTSVLLLRRKWKMKPQVIIQKEIEQITRNPSYENLFTQSHEVLQEYEPMRPDEVRLKMGDKVTLQSAFSDGWALVVNNSTGESGAAPLVCMGLHKIVGLATSEANVHEINAHGPVRRSDSGSSTDASI